MASVNTAMQTQHHASDLSPGSNGSGAMVVVRPRKPEPSWLILAPVGILLGLCLVQLADRLMMVHQPSSLDATTRSPDARLRGPRHLDGPPADVVLLRLHDIGELRVRLRPDLSGSSADFVREAATARCAGTIDRADEMAVRARLSRSCAAGAPPQTVVAKGSCPPGIVRACPPDKPECSCHGPPLSRGMVAWADGGTGPEFVVVVKEQVGARQQFGHTIIGEVEGGSSWRALDRLRSLPVVQTDDGWLKPRSAAFRVATAA